MVANTKALGGNQPTTPTARTPLNHTQQALLKQINQLAWLLDNSIRLPLINYRIGLDAIVGLVPGLGDVAGALVSSYIVLQAMRLGVPRGILARMVGNVALEAAVGLIPVVGDFFDATFKANARNVQLLNDLFAAAPATQNRQPVSSRGVIAVASGALLGLLALVGGAGITIFQRFLRLWA